MFIDFLLQVFEANKEKEAIIWKDKIYTYDWLNQRIKHWLEYVKNCKVAKGAVVGIEADFSPDAISLFLALIENQNILVPLTESVTNKKNEYLSISKTEFLFSLDKNDEISLTDIAAENSSYQYYQLLRESFHPGLVLFSSGTTGESKATVHDFVKILGKFKIPQRAIRSIVFLLYDHIGGINTMLQILSNAGCIVIAPERTPQSVLETIEKHQVELLPVVPTFINLILLSEAYKCYKLSSLKIISYGTEPMLESTLKKIQSIFPNVKLVQKYGLSEAGILQTKTKSSGSLWLKLGGEGVKTRIVEGMLEIKSDTAMLGYLNAPSPFTEDGWLKTGDVVKVDGEYMQILGRDSELINVGGQKVYPTEVENVIQEIKNIKEVAVYGEKNHITGTIVCASITLINPEDKKEITNRIRRICKEKLENFKVPIRITITDNEQHNARFKKMRNSLKKI